MEPRLFTEAEQSAASSSVLKKIMPICPCCLRSIVGHEYGLFAVAAGREDMGQLLKFSERREWEKLRALQSFEGTENAIDATLIRCSETSGVLMNILNPHELWESHVLLKSYVLDESEWMNATDVTPTLQWRPIAT